MDIIVIYIVVAILIIVLGLFVIWALNIARQALFGDILQFHKRVRKCMEDDNDFNDEPEKV